MVTKSWRFFALTVFAFGTLSAVAGVETVLAQVSPDSSIALRWTAPGDDGNVGRATSYDLRYRTVNVTGTDTLGWWNAATQVTGEPVPRTAGQTDSVRVAGLIPGTTYYFIIRAADEVPNWSGFSNIAVRSPSSDATPPAAVADLSITGTTGNSLALRWTAPGDDGNTGTASSYDIRYSTSTITNSNWTSATQATGEPAPAAAGTTQTFTLGSLLGGQTYYVAIRATDNSSNVSALSNVVNGTTAGTCNAPTAAPQQFAAAEDNSASDVLLSWDPTSDPLAAFIHIYWATGTGSFSLLTSIDAAETQYRHDTVSPGATYRYRAAWAAACGEGPQTSIVSITLSGPPPPPPPPDVANPDLHAYPNPAPGPVEFVLTLSGTADVPVHIRLFDLAGHWVADLMNGTYSPGANRVTWARTARDGQSVAPGYYEAIGTAGEERVRERIVLLP